MRHKIYGIRQKPFAVSSVSDRFLPGNCHGGGLGVMFLCLAILMLVLAVFLNMADYALYSVRYVRIHHGLDYAVSAAVEEIDEMKSGAGLAQEFKEDGGQPSMDNIYLDEIAADNAFFDTFKANTGIDRFLMEPIVLILQVNPVEAGLEYTLHIGSDRRTGLAVLPDEFEAIINDALAAHRAQNGNAVDISSIFVVGNPRTNAFKKRPYYMAVIENYEVDGLFRKKTATFVGFAAAKIERVENE